MSIMGAISTNLHCASQLLGPYLDAQRAVESRGGCVERPDEAKSLLAVLTPLCYHLRGRTYFALGVNGEEMSEFLRLRHREGWPAVRDGILSIEARLEDGAGGRVVLSGEDLSILGGISDALDSVCASLFSEMRRRRAPATWDAPSASRSTGPGR